MDDILGQAIWDFYNNKRQSKLWIHNKYGKKEEMPVQVYFRDEEEMPELELMALESCKGKVLDIGAGAGSHALLLEEKGVKVTALEISPLAAEVMEKRGVKNIVEQDVFTYDAQQYDTLLLLMNGIGLTGTIDGCKAFLQQARKLIKTGGQVLFDSSDVAYLYDGDMSNDGKYYGEILYQYEYKKQKTEWFSWLYIDQNTMKALAAETGWDMEILFVDEFDQYLARLTQL